MKNSIGKYCLTKFCLGLSFYSALGQTLPQDHLVEPSHENFQTTEDSSKEELSDELDLILTDDDGISESLDLLEDDDEIFHDHDEEKFDKFYQTNGVGIEEKGKLLSAIMENARFSLNHQLGYGFQTPRKIVSNRSSLRVEWESDFGENLLFHFDGKGSIHYSNDHLTKAQKHSPEAYGTVNLRESFFQGSFGDWAFKVGRQILIWGESYGSVLNEVSPQDQREVYFTSLEDSRIGQILTRITYFSRKWEWEIFVNPDSKTNKLPEKKTEYYIALPENDTDIHVQEITPSETEVGLRIKRYLEAGDFAFFAAKLNENKPFYDLKSEKIGDKTNLEKMYPSYQLVGLGGNLNYGSTLLKGELAHKSKKWFAAINSTDSVIKKNTLEMALDIEYQLDENVNFYVGVSDQHILEWEESINGIENTVNYFLGGNHSFYNESMDLDYILNYDKQNDFAVHRLTINYKIIDDLNLDISTVFFDPSKPNKGIGMHFQNKSRITANLTYYF